MYVIMLVMLSFVVFRFDDLKTVSSVYQGMFGLLDIPYFSHESLYHLKSYATLFLTGCIGATPIVINSITKMIKNMKGAKWFGVLEVAGLGFLYLLSASYLVDGSFNPFLYFMF